MPPEHRIRRVPSEGEALALDIDATHLEGRLQVSQINRRLVQDCPDILADLIEIAALVYFADAALSRGGSAARQMGVDWRRNLHFEIPVRCRAQWESEEVIQTLTDTLGFLSDDHYTFAFVDHDGRKIGETIPFDFGPDEGWTAEETLLFSGGLDSFAGAAEAAIERGRRLALVSHRSAPFTKGVQNKLLKALVDHVGQDQIRHFPIEAQFKTGATKETTHRSRSFLFAALGLVVAQGFGLDRVEFYENGVVSLNLPPSEQFVGARATRSTHPLALHGLSRLFTILLGSKITVGNPFLWRTKTEIFTRIADLGLGDHIRHTHSCAHIRAATRMTPNCGRCSQCIDRRFAAIAAGLTDQDPAESYAVDLLYGPRHGPDRELALGYVRNARIFRTIAPSRLFAHFPELARALDALDLEHTTSLKRFGDLLARHGRGVTSVMENALDVVPADLSPDSLLALYNIADTDTETDASRPTKAPEPLLIEIDETRKRARIGRDLVLSGTNFTTLATFANRHLESLGTGCAPEDHLFLAASTLLSVWELKDEASVRRRVQALRRAIAELEVPCSDDAIENLPWHGYRLRPERILVRKVCDAF